MIYAHDFVSVGTRLLIEINTDNMDLGDRAAPRRTNLLVKGPKTYYKL